MLEHISWKDFFIALGCACAVYYAIMAIAGKVRFNRPKVEYDPSPPFVPGRKTEFPGSATLSPERRPATEPEEDAPSDLDEQEDAEFTELEVLADALQIIITQFASTDGSKEQLLEQLSSEIARYPALRQPAFQRAVSNLIIKASLEECGFTITKDEADNCWQRLSFADQQ